jgi:hypothetical protein
LNSVLQEAIAGEPVLVKLGGQEYPLAFPIQAVILYKKETARLDRERAEERRKQGVAKLTREEIRDLGKRRRQLLKEADALRPGKDQKWDDENYEQCETLLAEATLLKCAIDEDAGTGDSLYDLYNWRKISPEADPERMLLALWVGLHEFNSELPGVSYQPQLSRDEIGWRIHPGNAIDLTLAISKALAAHIIAPPEVEEEEAPDPNALTPEIPAVIEPVTDWSSPPNPWKKRES